MGGMASHISGYQMHTTPAIGASTNGDSPDTWTHSHQQSKGRKVISRVITFQYDQETLAFSSLLVVYLQS